MWTRLDIRDAAALTDVVATFQPDAVFHLGARTDLHGSQLAQYDANTTGTSNVIAALLALDRPSRAVFASSGFELAAHPAASTTHASRPATSTRCGLPIPNPPPSHGVGTIDGEGARKTCAFGSEV